MKDMTNVTKALKLAGIGVGEIHCRTGKAISAFADTHADGTLMGMTVSHVHNQGAGEAYMGTNFRLNLHERFEPNDSLTDENGALYAYVYTDGKGVRHGFHQFYYYLDESGAKSLFSTGDANISVDSKGRLCYYNIEVFTDYQSKTGWRAVTELNNYKYVDYYDARTDEEKQLEDTVNSYVDAFNSIRLMELVTTTDADGNTTEHYEEKYRMSDYISSHEQFEKFLDQISTSKHTLFQGGQAVESGDMDAAVESLVGMYRDYVMQQAELDEYRLQNPVNYLTDGKIVKGFNADGYLVAVFDKYGKGVFIRYERFDVATPANTRIASVYDDQNNTVTFSYNARTNMLSSITDTQGRVTSYTYDTSGALTDIRHDTGTHLVLTYTSGEITSVQDKNTCLETTIGGHGTGTVTVQQNSTVSAITVDSSTAATETVPMSTLTFAFTDNTDGTATTLVTDGYNNKEQYTFNAAGEWTGYAVEEKGVVTKAEQYEYTPYWNKTTINTYPWYVVTKADKSTLHVSDLNTFTFVGKDKVTETFDSFERVAQKKVEENFPLYMGYGNKITTVTDYTYDDAQKLIQEKATVTYFLTGKIVTSYKKYAYNGMGDVIRTESYVVGEEYTTGKTVQEWTYDDQGNVVQSCTYNSLDSSSKLYSQTDYDESGQVTATYDESGAHKTQYAYANGGVKEEILPNGGKFAYGYDHDGKVTSVTQSAEDGEANTTQRIYRCGELVQLTAGNTKVQYEYDQKRRLSAVRMTGNSLNNTLYAYLSTGSYAEEKITTTKYNGGVVDERQYDNNHRLEQYTLNGVIRLQNVYTADGKLNVASDKISQMDTRFVYDDFDRVSAVYETDNSAETPTEVQTESYTYDAYGAISQKTLSEKVSQTYAYAYKDNVAHTLESVTVSGVTFKPQADVLGRNTGRKLYSGENILAEERIYYKKVGDHATGLPSSVWFGTKAGISCRMKDNLRYAYDTMGNISKVYKNETLIIRYAYDKLNRLIREDNKPLDKTVCFVYDNNGNILKQKQFAYTMADDLALESLEATEKVYLYDGDKLLNVGGSVCLYATTGILGTYRGKFVTWENGTYLTKYGNIPFTYDGQGRRLSKNTIRYVYDSEGRLIKQTFGEEAEFFYDTTGVAGMIYNDVTYLYRKDVQGNVLALINAADGTVVATYDYDAWGNHAVTVVESEHANAANLNPFRYRSYIFDPETKLYYLKNRYYDPEIGRFISPDGIDYIDPETVGGVNLYAYCGNNPVMRVDENGNAWWHWLLGAVAVVSLVAVVVASAVVTGGASLVAMGVGFAVGATASVVSQGVTNVINGNGFFDNINIGTVLIGGLAGAAFAGAAFVPGVGGLAGAFGIGLAANVATSSIEQKSIGEILFNGLVGGLAAGLAFGVGQFLSNAVYSSNGFTFTTFFDAARVDGANLFRATLTGFASSWYKFLPNLAPGISRAIFNMIGKREGNLFND